MKYKSNKSKNLNLRLQKIFLKEKIVVFYIEQY